MRFQNRRLTSVFSVFCTVNTTRRTSPPSAAIAPPLIRNGSWINNFRNTFLGDYDVPNIEQMRNVKKLPNGETPGDPGTMRYASGTTLMLQFVCEAIEQKPWGVILQERVWSKAGFRNPARAAIALASEVMSGFQRRRTVLKPLSGSPGVNAKFTPADLAPMAEEP